MNATEAQDILWRATIAVEQGKVIDAMRIVGMDLEWMEDLSVDEATEIFQVRVHDLTRIATDGGDQCH